MRPLSVFRVLFLLLYAVRVAAQPSEKSFVEVSVESLTYPAWTGCGFQPLFQIRVDVPERSGQIEVRSFNARTRGYVPAFPDSVQLFYTGSEPSFNSRQPLGNVLVSQSEWSSSLVRSLTPGIHFFWICARIDGGKDMSTGIILARSRAINPWIASLPISVRTRIALCLIGFFFIFKDQISPIAISLSKPVWSPQRRHFFWAKKKRFW